MSLRECKKGCADICNRCIDFLPLRMWMNILEFLQAGAVSQVTEAMVGPCAIALSLDALWIITIDLEEGLTSVNVIGRLPAPQDIDDKLEVHLADVMFAI